MLIQFKDSNGNIVDGNTMDKFLGNDYDPTIRKNIVVDFYIVRIVNGNNNYATGDIVFIKPTEIIKILTP